MLLRQLESLWRIVRVFQIVTGEHLFEPVTAFFEIPESLLDIPKQRPQGRPANPPLSRSRRGLPLCVAGEARET